MKIRIVVRGFAGSQLVFEDRVEEEDSTLDLVLPKLAEKHAAAIAAHKLHMIEIEFLDEPGPERFFRVGTDPSHMVMPLRVL